MNPVKREKKIEPKLRMGVTEVMGSDRYPYEVVRILDKKTCHILIRRLVYENQAVWPEQNFAYKSDPNASTIELETYHGELRVVDFDPATLKVTHQKSFWYHHYILGEARYYQDPSF